jgi:hypothetical protein
LIQFLLVFADHCDDRSSGKNALHQRPAKPGAAACNQYMLITEHYWLAEGCAVSPQVLGYRHKNKYYNEDSNSNLKPKIKAHLC